MVKTRYWIISGLIMALSGCALPAAKRQSVDDLLTRQQARTRLAVGAVNTPPLTAPEQAENSVGLLEVGELALAARIYLARSATEQIEVQSFIYRADDTGRLLMHELLQAARRGVKVRLLLDQLFSFKDLEYLRQLSLAHENFEVRFYNPIFHKAVNSRVELLLGAVCCFTRINQRMHNKLFVADRQMGVTGGRNIADRYFDYDTAYNFKDREVLLRGPAVADMTQSFDWYWDSELTQPIVYLKDVAQTLLQNTEPLKDTPYKVPQRLQPLLEKLQNPAYIAQTLLDVLRPVERLVYFSDPPAKSGRRLDEYHRGISRTLFDALNTARESVVIQSPYLVLSYEAQRLFKRLKRRHPELSLVFSTNSLASTDAFSVYGITHKHKKRYVKKLRFHLYEFKPFPDDSNSFFPRMPALIEEKANGISSGEVIGVGQSPTLDLPAPRAGLHAKSFVVDGYIAMVGSHNFDPRSERLNTENGVIVWDREFAGLLEQEIRRDIEPGNSWVIAAKQKAPLVSDLGGVIQDVSRSLPIFDLWPFRYTTAYELKPGAQVQQPGSPAFYSAYMPVGSFPQVILTKRQVQTLIVSSFFGFLAPIL